MTDTASTAQGEILIADDLTTNLQLLSDVLSHAGYKVRPAGDGETVLRSVKARLPDLILLDVKMPGMDGFQLCRQIKTDKKTKDIPIIFISALDEISDKVKGFSAGGVDYITKPFNKEEVLARVDVHLRLRAMRKEIEEKNRLLQKTNESLNAALNEIKYLRGILPICSYCKKVRDDKGYWNQIESYIEAYSDVQFSHSICQECAKRIYPDMDLYD